MKRFLCFFLMLSIMVACEDKAIESQESTCRFGNESLKRGEMVRDLIVTVTTAGSQLGSFQLVRAGGGNATPLGICNLQAEYRQAGLELVVSGYFLTSPHLETMNLSPLPFDVTTARKR